MSRLYKSSFPTDKVKIYRKGFSIQARGRNGRLLVGVVALILVSIGTYFLAKTKLINASN